MDEAGASLNEARLLDAKGRWDEAIQQYRHALELEPANSAARRALGYLLCQKFLYTEAVGEYEILCHLKPEDPTPRILLSQTLIKAGQKKRAGAEADRAMQMLAQLSHLQTEAFPRFGTVPDLDRPSEQGLRTLDSTDGQAFQFAQLGSALFALHRYTDALPWFERARFLRPDDAAVHYGLGATLTLLGRLDEAVPELFHVFDAKTWNRQLPQGMRLIMHGARSVRSDALNIQIRDLARKWKTRQPESIEAQCAVAEFEWRCGNRRLALQLLSDTHGSIPTRTDRARDWASLFYTYWLLRQWVKAWGVFRISWRYWWVYSLQWANEQEQDEQHRPPIE